MGQDYNAMKFKELILYVAKACEKDPKYGAIKLNKILFRADFNAYARFGRSITGAEYRKYPRGPCPALMKVVKRELDEAGDAYEHPQKLGVNQDGDPIYQRPLYAQRDANLTLFSAEELELVNEAIDWAWGKTAKQLTDETHRTSAWRNSRMGDTLPYFTVFLPDQQPVPSKKDLEWARAIVDALPTANQS